MLPLLDGGQCTLVGSMLQFLAVIAGYGVGYSLGRP